MWPTRWIVPPEVPALFPALEALNSRRYVGPARKGWARGGVGRSGDIYVHAARSVYTRDTRVILKRMVATLLGAALAFSKRIKFENKLFERLGTKDVAQSSATRKQKSRINVFLYRPGAIYICPVPNFPPLCPRHRNYNESSHG